LLAHAHVVVDQGTRSLGEKRGRATNPRFASCSTLSTIAEKRGNLAERRNADQSSRRKLVRDDPWIWPAGLQAKCKAWSSPTTQRDAADIISGTGARPGESVRLGMVVPPHSSTRSARCAAAGIVLTRLVGFACAGSLGTIASVLIAVRVRTQAVRTNSSVFVWSSAERRQFSSRWREYRDQPQLNGESQADADHSSCRAEPVPRGTLLARKVGSAASRAAGRIGWFRGHAVNSKTRRACPAKRRAWPMCPRRSAGERAIEGDAQGDLRVGLAGSTVKCEPMTISCISA